MFAALIRLLRTEPAAISSVASVLYAAGIMLYRAEVAHTGVFQPDVLVAAAVAVWGLWTRINVTPVADPRNNRGQSLLPL